MGRKNNQLSLTIVVCSILGIIFGATASQAEIHQCLTDDTPSNQCLMQSPTEKRLEGMFTGLFVGAGAAIGATWQVSQKR
ncbi:MAG: hypothetical protein IGS50_07985 [Synechococcales cyanobacterium C42_A2020_086]|jgi:hypothetical protein|nr:hypothetical protein [Synechococcales cyanobacterium M58_A2018_015]MBF2073686.1 hypothetical protein [Synechococcales cyanobacterium C42_A2020_086]